MLHLRLRLVLCALCHALWASSAFAWLEISIKSDNVVIDIDQAGSAKVEHEILMRVRGGPLKALRIVGVDADAKPLADALLFNAASGRASGPGIPLVAMVEASDVQLTVEGGNRVGPGHYVLRFAYQTELLARGLITTQAELATLRWVGPRFNDGIDSVRVVFRLPHAATVPHVPDADPAGGQLGIVAEYDGVFLSDFRSANDKDELEVVRPHVAKGEPVVWRVRFDAGAVGLRPQLASIAGEVPQQPKVEAPRRSRSQLNDLWMVALTGFVYGLLVWYKAKSFGRAVATVGASARPLVPLRASFRAVLAALTLSAATAALLLSAWPLLALPALVSALALGTELAPHAPATRRGPGSWRSVSAAQAFSNRRTQTYSVGLLDIGHRRGMVAFLIAIVTLLVLASQLFNVAAPRGVCLATEALVLLPLFFTGRQAQLPVLPMVRSRPALWKLYQRLSKQPQRQVTVLGRFPQNGQEPDELRLLVMPHKPLFGLNAIEIAYDSYASLSGLQVAPLVLVRANEGSPAYEAISRDMSWSRGRTAGERACIVRPRVPTVGGTLALVQQLCELLGRGHLGKSLEHSPSPSATAPRSRVVAA